MFVTHTLEKQRTDFNEIWYRHEFYQNDSYKECYITKYNKTKKREQKKKKMHIYYNTTLKNTRHVIVKIWN